MPKIVIEVEELSDAAIREMYVGAVRRRIDELARRQVDSLVVNQSNAEIQRVVTATIAGVGPAIQERAEAYVKDNFNRLIEKKAEEMIQKAIGTMTRRLEGRGP